MNLWKGKSIWIELNWIELNWFELNWIELNWIQFNSIQLNWIELFELNWIEFNWIELNWIELNRIESNWIELNWIELNWIECSARLVPTYYLETMRARPKKPSATIEPRGIMIPTQTGTRAAGFRCAWMMFSNPLVNGWLGRSGGCFVIIN